MSRTGRPVLVLLSGGVDSAACLEFYLRQKFDVSALHVQFGQPGEEHEWRAACRVAKHYGAQVRRVQLVGDRGSITSEFEIRGRNLFLLSAALLNAPFKSGLIAMGLHSGSDYADCSSSFRQSANSLLGELSAGRIRADFPFGDVTKREIADFCRSRQVPVNLTYSCLKGKENPCRKCPSCLDLELVKAIVGGKKRRGKREG